MSVKGKTVNMGEKMRMAQTEEGKIGVIEEWQGQIQGKKWQNGVVSR